MYENTVHKKHVRKMYVRPMNHCISQNMHVHFKYMFKETFSKRQHAFHLKRIYRLEIH